MIGLLLALAAAPVAAGPPAWTAPMTPFNVIGNLYDVSSQGISADYRATFAKLKTMKADVFLAPHPEQFDLAAEEAKMASGAPNPFIDPSELQKRVAAGETAFEAGLAKQEAE